MKRSKEGVNSNPPLQLPHTAQSADSTPTETIFTGALRAQQTSIQEKASLPEMKLTTSQCAAIPCPTIDAPKMSSSKMAD